MTLDHQTDKQISGQQGEDEALKYLRSQSLILVQRNFRCKGGEIDLVMRDGNVLVFVEVRKRANDLYGGAAASVTSAKRKRIALAAQVFLLRYKMVPACRFDVIAIDGTFLNWMKNAFEVS